MKRLSLGYSILISLGILLATTSSALPDVWGTSGAGGGGVTSADLAITSPVQAGGGSLTTAEAYATAFDTWGIQPSLEQIARSSWLALSSGVASIISLMLTLYGTQIKTIPFSLYRSYVWNKVLLLSFGIGIIVFAGIQFYTQTEPPGYPPLNYIFNVLHGKHTYFFSSGTNLWGFIFFIGAAISIWGIIYDPVQISKSVMFREHEALLEYRKKQLASVVGKDDYENLKSHERHLYDDLSDFHAELQTRLIDTVYGQGLLPMYSRRMRSHDWPTQRMDRTD